MNTRSSQEINTQVTLRPVDSKNWRDVARLKVAQDQREFVAEPCYYLALCHYGDLWRPLAIYLGEQVIGFMMWAVDPDDGSCWLGGILIDQGHQGQGYGRRAVQTAMDQLAQAHGHQHFALSYNPSNAVARHVYKTLGFVETDEWEDAEVVARLSLAVQTTG